MQSHGELKGRKNGTEVHAKRSYFSFGIHSTTRMPSTDGKDVPGFYHYVDSPNAVRDHWKRVNATPPS